MEELTELCKRYVANGDDDMLISGVRSIAELGKSHDITTVLTKPEQQDILVKLGWELLMVIPVSDDTLILINKIAEVGVAKEILLGLLELLGDCADIWGCVKLFEATKTALIRLPSETALGSSLCSVTMVISKHYQLLSVDNDDDSSHGDQLSPDKHEHHGNSSHHDIISTLEHVIKFVEPFVDRIHGNSCLDHMIYWTPTQQGCVCMLLTMLGVPLVDCDLHMSTLLLANSQAVMQCLCLAHCNSMKVLEYDKYQSSPNMENTLVLPPEGVASYAHMILVEGICQDYLPSVISSHYLVNICVKCVIILLSRTSGVAMMKGISLLMNLVGRVTPATMTTTTLDEYDHQKLITIMCNVMATCPHDSVRRECVSSLPHYLKVFSSSARYRLYQGLLRGGTSHAGVTGFLIQLIKNEVNDALKGGDTASPFVAPQLSIISRLVFSLPGGDQCDLLNQSDRVMATLNFLRYLLIRDTPADNRTGVWSSLKQVEQDFLKPLRSCLRETQHWCCQRLRELTQEQDANTSHHKQKGVADLSVKVIGDGVLPGVTTSEEIKMIMLAQHQLDMMTCVLTRVDELLTPDSVIK